MKRSTVLGLVAMAAALVAVAAGWRAASRAEPQPTRGADEAAPNEGSNESSNEGSNDGPRQGLRSMPWLHNFAASAESAAAAPDVVERMARWRAPDPSCSAAAYGGLVLAADVAAARGTEEVLASYTQGVLVLDARGRLIASAPPAGCQGSADELDAIAAGDAYLDGPVIALAATAGGHREASTWLGLYRVIDGAVVAIFVGTVEDYSGGRSRTGDVTLLPGALLYRAPSGAQALWVYRTEQHRYVEVAAVLPPEA